MPHLESDSELGWGLKTNFFHEFQMPGKPQFSTNSLGLRESGQVDGELILVLGDSFTAEAGVSNQDMWFSVLSAKLGELGGTSYRVMAGGAGGYGTAQQLILARRIKTKIDPKIVILQFCLNDYMNNHRKWESYGVQRHQILLRPYTEDGEVFYRSEHFLSYLYNSPLFEYWRGISFLDLLVQAVEHRMYGSYFRPLDADQEGQIELASFELTTMLLAKLRREFPQAEAYLLNVADMSLLSSQSWQKMAQSAGYQPLERHIRDLKEAVEAQESIYFPDGVHWNAAGNHIVGRSVAHEIYEYRQSKL